MRTNAKPNGNGHQQVSRRRLTTETGIVLRNRTPAAWTGPDVTFGSLVAGLETIKAVAIPYARLPGRARTVYGPHYALWGDIADTPMDHLYALPGAAEQTVRAVLDAARETAEAHRPQIRRPASATEAANDLLCRLGDRDRIILTRLVFPVRPDPVDHVAAQIGVDPSWFVRNRPRVKARFVEMLAEPAHREAARYIDTLRLILGPYIPSDMVTQALSQIHVSPDSDADRLYRYAAGPYVPRDDWSENGGVGGRQRVLSAVDRAFDASPAQTAASLTDALNDAGMPAPAVLPFLDKHFTLRWFDDTCVRWGPHSKDQVAAVLHAHGRPMTVEAIHSHLDGGQIANRSLRHAIIADRRFVRATRTTWALREWGLDQYLGVAEEVGRRIDAAGGQIAVTALVADMQAAFPDVAYSSVEKYLYTLATVHENGMLRRRRNSDPWPEQPHWNTVRGTFRHGAGLRFMLPVTSEVLRGSGSSIPQPFAAALGIKPGESQQFTTPHGQTPLAWPLWTTNGSRLGSVQALARDEDAEVGDHLLLTFTPGRHTLTANRIPAGIGANDVLEIVTGLDALTTAAIARSLDCARDKVVAVLRRRGDTDLAATMAQVAR